MYPADSVIRARRFPDKSTIVLGDFSNTSGDPVFDGTLRQMMAVELGKSPDVSVLPDARMRETLRLMVRPADVKVTAEIAAEICERTGSAAVVEGSIARLGRQYVLGLSTRDCRTGNILDGVQISVTKKEDVFKVLRQMAKRFGTHTGALSSMEKQTAMTAEITTSSLEAWRSYNAGMTAAMRKGAYAEAVSLYKRAIEVDPKFAMAYALLGRAYDSLGHHRLIELTFVVASLGQFLLQLV